MLWDDEYLYVGFWVEEPFVAARLTERDALIWSENDVEVFVAGSEAYYELELNALGTIYEALFVWEDAYERLSDLPDLARSAARRSAEYGTQSRSEAASARAGTASRATWTSGSSAATTTTSASARPTGPPR